MCGKGRELMDSSTAIYKESRAEQPSERRLVAYARQRCVDAKERSNDHWLAALRGPRKDQALAELRTILVRGLRAALRGGANGAESLVEEFAEEALIKILANTDSLRGQRSFTVWAQKVAVRTACAEMRRRRWRDVSLDEASPQRNGSATTPGDSLAAPD